jgi:hypothetical protein
MGSHDGQMNSDSHRTALDHHAIVAAGQLLMSAIWLEHRVRRFSTRLVTWPLVQASVVSVVGSPAAGQSDQAAPS